MSIVYRQLYAKQDQVLHTADVTLKTSDSYKDHNIATDAKTFTLPAISAVNLGTSFTFRNTGADGAVKLNISPASTDAIAGTIAVSVAAGAASTASGVLNKDFGNTKATANQGDFVTLTAVSVGLWVITNGVGIWASEA